MSKALAGQAAIVTGGARGSGRGIAARLAAMGCRIVVWNHDLAGLGEAAAGFRPSPSVVVDVGDYASAEHIAAAKARIPMGRSLTVGEIAAVVARIAGPEAASPLALRSTSPAGAPRIERPFRHGGAMTKTLLFRGIRRASVARA